MKRLLCIIFICITVAGVFTGCGGGGESSDVSSMPQIASETTDSDSKPQTSSNQTDTTKIESDKYAVAAIEEVFIRKLNYIVPDDEVDSDSAVSNAVIRKTTVKVNAANKEYCDVTVTYPDIEKEFVAALVSAGEDEAAADTALYALAEKIENGTIPLTEKDFVLKVKYEYYIYDVISTAEFTDALMGGMYLLDEGVL